MLPSLWRNLLVLECINLWSIFIGHSANVNLIIDTSHNLANSVTISKDAKVIIPTDISPTLVQGQSGKPGDLPDHSWDQSRTHAVTPMTFLFLLLKVELSPASSVVTATSDTCNTSVLEITRTGQGVTLLNFEPDTTFKCLNELVYLLTIPALDTFFRDDWKTEEAIHFGAW